MGVTALEVGHAEGHQAQSLLHSAIPPRAQRLRNPFVANLPGFPWRRGGKHRALSGEDIDDLDRDGAVVGGDALEQAAVAAQ